MQKKRNAIMAILSIVLAAALSVGGTLAYMTDSEKLINTFKVGDLDVTFEEPNYPAEECEEHVPGDSFPKDPTVKQVKGDAYMRVKVEFLTLDDNLITGERLDLILKTIYYDPAFSSTIFTSTPDPVSGDPGGIQYKGSANLRLRANNLNNHDVETRYHYSTTKLGQLVSGGLIQNWFNRDAFDVLPGAGAPVTGVFYLNYKANNGIFTQGTEVKLFTSIVYPSDWNQMQLQMVGSYKIKMTTEVIQAANFASRAQAYAALDAETVLVDYGVTSPPNY